MTRGAQSQCRVRAEHVAIDPRCGLSFGPFVERFSAAVEVLAATDPVIRRLEAETGPVRIPRPRNAHFAALVQAIVFQQLATAAAPHLPPVVAALGDVVEPETVAAMSDETMRAVGMSGNKTRSLHDLAAKVLDGTVDLSPRRLARRPDEEIVERLTSVRGIGPWSAEMFLIFQLRRLDVWPVSDLAIRRGYGIGWQRPTPTARELEPLGDPYRRTGPCSRGTAGRQTGAGPLSSVWRHPVADEASPGSGGGRCRARVADGSIVSLALPRILVDLHTSVVGLAAILFVYMAVLAVAALVAGQIGGRRDARHLASGGFALVAVARLVCASAQSLEVMLAGRAIGAAGGGICAVASFELLEGGGRGARAWSWRGVAGLAAGPALGGVLTQVFEWRAIFIVQVPVAGAASLVAYTWPATSLAPSRASSGELRDRAAAGGACGVHRAGVHLGGAQARSCSCSCWS